MSSGRETVPLFGTRLECVNRPLFVSVLLLSLCVTGRALCVDVILEQARTGTLALPRCYARRGGGYRLGRGHWILEVRAPASTLGVHARVSGMGVYILQNVDGFPFVGHVSRR